MASQIYSSLLLNVNSRITNQFWHGGPHFGETMGILEKNNIALILDKLALLEDSVDLGPSTRATLNGNTSICEFFINSGTCFPTKRGDKIQIKKDRKSTY